jgi:transcriptional regulator with XRE-family HTH domain
MEENDAKHQGGPRLSQEALRQLGSRVAERRRAKGLSQRELERLAGFSSSRLSRIERGHSVAQLGELVGLHKILGIDLDELVFGRPAGEARQSRLAYLVHMFERVGDPTEVAVLERMIFCLTQEKS